MSTNKKDLRNAIDGDMGHIGGDSQRRTYMMMLIDKYFLSLVAIAPILIVAVVYLVTYLAVLLKTLFVGLGDGHSALNSDAGFFDEFIVDIGSFWTWGLSAIFLQALFGRVIYYKYKGDKDKQTEAMSNDIHINGPVLHEDAADWNNEFVAKNQRFSYSKDKIVKIPLVWSGKRPDDEEVVVKDSDGQEFDINEEDEEVHNG